MVPQDDHYDLVLPLNDVGETTVVTFQNGLSAPGGDLEDYISIAVPGDEVLRNEVEFVLVITCSGPGVALVTLSVADGERECGETIVMDIFGRDDVGIWIQVRSLSIAIITYTIRATLQDGPAR